MLLTAPASASMRSALACGLVACLLVAPTPGQSTTRLSVNAGGQEGNGNSQVPLLSANGRYAVYSSDSSNLVAGDTNGLTDVFVSDRQTGVTERVSVASSGAEGNGGSYLPSISGDGQIVVFHSFANNLVSGDANTMADVFVHDRQTGTTTCISVDSAGQCKSGTTGSRRVISEDGRHVVFASYSADIVSGDANARQDVFLHDRLAGLTTIISRDSLGAQANGHSYSPSISRDGRTVAFMSNATNLSPGDVNRNYDVFVVDVQSGGVTRASVDSSGIGADAVSSQPFLSGDGLFVAFESVATNLVPGDTNGVSDIFVHELTTGITLRASVDSAGTQADGHSRAASLSDDGRHVAFESTASNLVLGDTNLVSDIFLHDCRTGMTTRASVDSSGAQSNGPCQAPSISGSGRLIAFSSAASNLVAGDANGAFDVFLRDRGPEAPSLIRRGTCPGSTSLTVEDASPGGFVAFLYGVSGTYVHPASPCPGAVLGISSPALGALRRATSNGEASLTLSLPAFACGLTVQAVDLSTCQVTHPIVL